MARGGDVVQTGKMRGIAELDLIGFASTEDDGVWQNAAGVFLLAGFQDSPPMSVLDCLLRDAVVGLLVSGATPMEYWIDFPGGLPAVFVMSKQRSAFGASLGIHRSLPRPAATCSVTIELRAAEQGADIGCREAFVLRQLGPDVLYVPRGMPVIKTPEGKPIRFDYADSHGIDRMFPIIRCPICEPRCGRLFPACVSRNGSPPPGATGTRSEQRSAAARWPRLAPARLGERTRT